MKKNLKMFKSSLIVFLFLIFTISLFITPSTSQDPLYKARVNVNVKWESEEFFEEPIIVPRDEVVQLNFTVKVDIVTGDTFGAGLLEGYSGQDVLIALSIVDHPTWCFATLKQGLLVTNLQKKDQANSSLYININENAPAYAEGFIDIRVNVGDLGLIKGDDQTFHLSFKPAFFPIIKPNYPEGSSKKVDPSTNAVFPIEIENAGNSRLKVKFEIENIPDGWSAIIRDSVIIKETKGSKETVYLTVIPSKGFGFHYDEAQISVKIIPTFEGQEDKTGNPIFATFIVKNRGLSISGIEPILFYGIIIFVIIILIVLFLKSRRKRKGKIS